MFPRTSLHARPVPAPGTHAADAVAPSGAAAVPSPRAADRRAALVPWTPETQARVAAALGVAVADLPRFVMRH